MDPEMMGVAGTQDALVSSSLVFLFSSFYKYSITSIEFYYVVMVPCLTNLTVSLILILCAY